MFKKLSKLIVMVIAFALFTSMASAISASISQVKVNGQVLNDGSNTISKASSFTVYASINALLNLNNAHVEAVLTDSKTGAAITDKSANFNLNSGSSSTVLLTLPLSNSFLQNANFVLQIKVIDSTGQVQKSYAVNFPTIQSNTQPSGSLPSGRFSVSIDRVRVNNNLAIEARTNVIDNSDDFDVTVDITALNNLNRGRIEVILRDTRSGTTVSCPKSWSSSWTISL